MNGVQLSQEIFIPLVLGIVSVMVALLGFLAWSMRHLSSFAVALKAHADVNASVNESLKSAYDYQRGLENERREMRREIDALRAKQDIYVSECERIERLEAKSIQLQSRIGMLEKERDQLKGEREILLTKVSELTAERDQQNVQIEKQKARIDQLEAKVDTLEKKGTNDGTATATELAAGMADVGHDLGHADPIGTDPADREAHDPAGEGPVGDGAPVSGESAPGSGSAERPADPVAG